MGTTPQQPFDVRADDPPLNTVTHMRYFTSDLHLGHENIIEYTSRPFNSVTHMHEGIVANWNSVVTPDDEVYILGDAALGDISRTLTLFSRLNGLHFLVPGNHDKIWSGRGAYHRDLYEQAGITLLPETHQITLGSSTVLLCHFPYHGDTKDFERFPEFRPQDTGLWLLHGHVHTKFRQRSRQINVGIDAWGGFPVAEDTLLDIIEIGPADRAVIPWTKP